MNIVQLYEHCTASQMWTSRRLNDCVDYDKAKFNVIIITPNYQLQSLPY